jgi:hypothetical protein
MTEKEKLIQELESRHTYGVKGILDTEIVVNFILEDRKRICKPLIKLDGIYYDCVTYFNTIKKVLKLAGLGKEK